MIPAPALPPSFKRLVPTFRSAAANTTNSNTAQLALTLTEASYVIGFYFSTGDNNQTITGLTINGAAPDFLYIPFSTASTKRLAIYGKLLPAGNHTIAAALSGNSGSSSSTCWPLWVFTGGQAPVVHAYVASNTNSGTSQSATIGRKARGCTLFASLEGNSAGNNTWTDATEVSDAADGNNRRTSCAQRLDDATETRTATVSWTPTSAYLLLAAISLKWPGT